MTAAQHKFVNRGGLDIITKFATVSTLSDRQIRAVISDGSIDRVGDIMEPSGCDLSGYNGKNSVILFNHNADAPVANGHVSVKGNQLAATITFPPEGTSATSDEVFKLVKSGVICACSIGFQPDQWELVEPHNRMGSGVRYTKWTLLEVSLVSVPCNANALVTEKSFKGSTSMTYAAPRCAYLIPSNKP